MARWIKYRHKFADGPGDWEWKFSEYDDEASLNEELILMREAFDYAEHYRGLEHEVHAHAPIEIVEKEVRYVERMIQYWDDRLKRLRKSL